MRAIPDLITDGFSLGFVIWLVVWGFSIVWRVIVRSLGLGNADIGGGG